MADSLILRGVHYPSFTALPLPHVVWWAHPVVEIKCLFLGLVSC